VKIAQRAQDPRIEQPRAQPLAERDLVHLTDIECWVARDVALTACLRLYIPVHAAPPDLPSIHDGKAAGGDVAHRHVEFWRWTLQPVAAGASDS
jgi:hypothetical protein